MTVYSIDSDIAERVPDLAEPSSRSAGGAAPNGWDCHLLIDWTAKIVTFKRAQRWDRASCLTKDCALSDTNFESVRGMNSLEPDVAPVHKTAFRVNERALWNRGLFSNEGACYLGCQDQIGQRCDPCS